MDQINWVLAPIFVLLGLAVGYLVALLQKQKVLEQKNQELTSLSSINDQLLRERDDLSSSYSELSEQKNELESSNAELDKKLALESNNLLNLKSQSDKNSQLLLENQSSLDLLSQSNSNLEKEKAALLETLKSANKESADLLQRVGKNEAFVNAANDEIKKLAAENAELKTAKLENEKNHRQQIAQFEEQKKQLAKEFENLANKIFEEKGKSFSEGNQKTLDLLLKPFKEQISEFRQRVDTIHKESNESTTKLKSQLDQLKELNQQMTADAHNLTRALKGEKKTTGNWGEIQLEKTLQLAGLVQGDHYTREEAYRDDEGKIKRPDFVIKLPDGKHLIIDSKVSLVDYDRSIAADTEDELFLHLNSHVKAIKNHIDGLSGKDYSNVLGVKSPNFVLMFMPIEAAYIEALKHNTELFNYGYEKNVILVSHTTLMPILRTVANLWMVERSNNEAREVADKAGEIFNQVCLLAERLQKLGNGLGAVSNHYNDTVKALVGRQGLYGKVERFSELSSKVSKTLPELDESHLDFETERLEAIELVEQNDLVELVDEEQVSEET